MDYDNIETASDMDMEKAKQALRDYIAQSGKEQTIVAKELGVSPGQVSAFLNDKYKTPHTLIPKIEKLLKIYEKREASPKEPGFKMTSISQQVISVIEY